MATETQYWLFQHSDSASVAGEVGRFGSGSVDQWRVAANRKRLKPADVVFFWMSGESGGLVGWGLIASDLKPEDELVAVNVQERFPTIPRATVRARPELSDLTVVMQGQPGTAFSVSARQAQGMAALIREHGSRGPEIDVEDLVESARRLVERGIAGLERFSKSARGDFEDRYLDDRVALYRAILDDPSQPVPSAPVGELPSGAGEEFQRKERELLGFLDEWVQVSALQKKPGQPPAMRISGAADTAFVPPPPPPPPIAAAAAPTPPPPVDLVAPASMGIQPWWETDRVGIGDAVKNLSRYIAHKSLKPPRAIGIFGEWGSGKSFFMSALRSQVANIAWQAGLANDTGTDAAFTRHILQIDFNAWHFVESNLWASLTAHIFESLHARLSEGAPTEADKLFATFETAKAAAEAAERAKLESETRLKALTDELEKVKSKLDDREAAAKAAEGALLNSLQASITKIVEDTGKSKRKEIEALLGNQSVEKAIGTGTDLVAVAKDAQGLLGTLALEMRSGNWRIWVFAALAVLLLAFLPLLLEQLWDATNTNDDIVKAFGTAGTYLAAFASAAAGLAARGRSVLAWAREVQTKVAGAKQEVATAHAQAIANAEKDLQVARADFDALSARLQREREAVTAARAAVDEHNDMGAQLKHFLEERVKGRTYEQHLGLLSVVRKDFERLSALMSGARPKATTKDAKVEAKDDAGATEAVVPVIERIVLYIDDLDRCSPEKVVEVLQAVHLLLGFELFVVVVGVDVRWVGRSLTKVYPELLADGSAAVDKDAWRAATADDYLEKIFQIPFRIPSMTGNARTALLNAALDEGFLKRTSSPGDSVTVPRLEMNPRELELHTEERQTMMELHACLGSTPRRLRRFVDVYRLMRAGMAEGDVESLIKTRSYRALLALFAMLTGAPLTGPRIVAQLQLALAAERTKVSSGLIAWLEEARAADATLAGGELKIARRVMEYLDAQQPGSMVEPLADWIPQVSSYTFREVRA